jgi:hypothetical protein
MHTMSTHVEEDRWRKLILGVIAVACFVTAAVVYVFFREQQAVLSGAIRIGAVLGALWFALPAPGERVRWGRIAPMLAVAVVLIVVTRRMILVLVPALVVAGILLALLRPKDKGRKAPLR